MHPSVTRGDVRNALNKLQERGVIAYKGKSKKVKLRFLFSGESCVYAQARQQLCARHSLRAGEVLNARAMRPAVPFNALHFAGVPWRFAVGEGGGL